MHWAIITTPSKQIKKEFIIKNQIVRIINIKNPTNKGKEAKKYEIVNKYQPEIAPDVNIK